MHTDQVKKAGVSRWSRMMDSDPEEEVMIESKVQPKTVPPQKDWASLIVRMKPDAPKGALKKKPAVKIRIVTQEEEARQSWYSAQLVPTKHGLFDIQKHGYWMSRSRGLFYRFPDGREVPATGVDLLV